MNELIFTSHAVDRMLGRQISSSLVRDIVGSPDGVIKQSLDKEIRYKRIKSRKDNLIAVVVVGKIEILTVMTYFEVKK